MIVSRQAKERRAYASALFKQLVITDFKLRYQGSALGVLWSVLKPLFLFAILYVVFDKFLNLGRDIEHFPVYLLLGIVLWTFFLESTVQGMQSIVARGDLIRKINFPKSIIIISATVSALINLGINLVVVIVFMLINKVDFGWSSLWIIPIIAELYVLALAIAFLLASVNVKYRDFGYLWEIFLQAMFYATPIIYPLQMVAAQSSVAAGALLLSPVAQIIQDARHALVTDDTMTLWNTVDTVWLRFTPFIIIVVIAVFAFLLFKRNSKKFAEQL